MTEEENGEEVSIEEYYTQAAEDAASIDDFLTAALPYASEVAEPLVSAANMPQYLTGLFREAILTAMPKLIERGLLPPDADPELLERNVLAKMEARLPALLTIRIWAAICSATMEAYYHSIGGPLTEREIRSMESHMAKAGRHPNLVVETRGQRGITTGEMVRALEKLGGEAPEAEQKDVAGILRRSQRAVQRWQKRKGFDDWKAARKFCIEKIPKAH
jgi:hypothetical protein